MSIYDIEDFSLPKNKFVLIVNIANQCGFSYQLSQLQALQDQYPNLCVIACHSNDFKQLSLTQSDLKQWCQANHHTSFLIHHPIHVNGPKTHPMYQFLKHNALGVIGQQTILWNFTKFLIYPHQHTIKRFSPIFPIPWLRQYLK